MHVSSIALLAGSMEFETTSNFCIPSKPNPTGGHFQHHNKLSRPLGRSSTQALAGSLKLLLNKLQRTNHASISNMWVWWNHGLTTNKNKWGSSRKIVGHVCLTSAVNGGGFNFVTALIFLHWLSHVFNLDNKTGKTPKKMHKTSTWTDFWLPTTITSSSDGGFQFTIFLFFAMYWMFVCCSSHCNECSCAFDCHLVPFCTASPSMSPKSTPGFQSWDQPLAQPWDEHFADVPKF